MKIFLTILFLIVSFIGIVYFTGFRIGTLIPFIIAIIIIFVTSKKKKDKNSIESEKLDSK